MERYHGPGRSCAKAGASLGLVFQGSVATIGKNWQLNQTTTDLDRTTVASPRGCMIGSVAVVVVQTKMKDRSQLVTTGLFYNQLKVHSSRNISI